MLITISILLSFSVIFITPVLGEETGPQAAREEGQCVRGGRDTENGWLLLEIDFEKRRGLEVYFISPRSGWVWPTAWGKWIKCEVEVESSVFFTLFEYVGLLCELVAFQVFHDPIETCEMGKDECNRPQNENVNWVRCYYLALMILSYLCFSLVFAGLEFMSRVLFECIVL